MQPIFKQIPKPFSLPPVHFIRVALLAIIMAILSVHGALAQWDYGEARNDQDVFYSIGAADYDGFGEFEINCFYWDFESEISPVAILYLSERQFWNKHPQGVDVEIDFGGRNGYVTIRDPAVHFRSENKVSLVARQTDNVLEYEFMLELLYDAPTNILIHIIDRRSGRSVTRLEFPLSGARHAVSQLSSWCEL